MKFIYFKIITLTAIAVMLAISSINTVYGYEIICNDPTGQGRQPTENRTNYTPFWGSWMASWTTPQVHQYMIPQAEIEAAGGMWGPVNSFSVRMAVETLTDVVTTENSTINIYLVNVGWNNMQDANGGGYPNMIIDAELTAAGYEAFGEPYYSKNNFSFEELHQEQFGGIPMGYDTTRSEEEKWVTFDFTKNTGRPFNYTGGSILVRVCVTGANDDHAMGDRFYIRLVDPGDALSGSWHYSGQNTVCGADRTSTTSSTGNYRPWIKLGMDYPPLTSNYLASEVQQSTLMSATRPGERDIPVIKVGIRVMEGEPVMKIDSMLFNGKTSMGVITSAKLYYSGTGIQAANSFDINEATIISTLDFPNATGNDNYFRFKFIERELREEGWHNFWLVYDIYKDSPVGDSIVDAKLEYLHLYDDNGDADVSVSPTKNSDPFGSIALLTNGYRYAGPVVNGNPTISQSVGGRVSDFFANQGEIGAPPGFNNNMEYMIMQYTPEAFGNVAGYIKRLALFIGYQHDVAGSSDMLNNVYIFMRNNTTTTDRPAWPTNIASKLRATDETGGWSAINMFSATEFVNLAERDGFTLVKGPFNWNIASWPNERELTPINNILTPGPNCGIRFWTEDIIFDAPFEYTGNNVDIIIFKANWHRAPGIVYGVQRRFELGGYDQLNADATRWGYANISPRNATMPTELTSGTFSKMPFGTSGNSTYNGSGFGTMQPYLRTYVAYIIGQYYNQPYSFHGAAGTAAGAKDANVKGVCIEITGEDEAPFIHIQGFNFAGTNNYSYVTNAKLYYTGNDSSFSTLNKIAPDFAIRTADDIQNMMFDLATTENENGLKLGLGKHYFWLSYEVAANAPNNQTLGANVTGCVINKVPDAGATETIDISNQITDNDPDSRTIINSQMEAGTYTVGPGGNSSDTRWRATLAELADEMTRRGVKGDVTINVIANISTTQAAVFGVSPSAAGVNFTLQSQGDNRFSITNTNGAARDSALPVIQLAGVTNFTIKNLNLTRTGLGTALKINGAENVIVENTSITGVSDAIKMVADKNFKINNNEFLGGSNYGINMINACADGEISGNTFSSVGNGIAMLNGPHAIDIYGNTFNSLANTTIKSAVFNIAGATDKQTLAINIMNNTIRDIQASDTASVFEITNASDVRIYHNTVLIGNAGSTKNVQMFYIPTNTSNLTIQNNLFSNVSEPAESARHQFYLIAYRAALFANIGDVDYNLYNGNPSSYTFGRNMNVNATVFSLNDWKLDGYEQNSNSSIVSANYADGSHTDGAVIGERGMLCPVLQPSNDWPNADIDVDGQRGIDNFAKYAGYTTVGADEVKISIMPIKPELPDVNFSCASASSSLEYEIENHFDKYADGISRTFRPEYRNYWFNTNGDSLTEANGWYAAEDIESALLSVPSPTIEQTCEFYCLTYIGYFQAKSNNSTLAVIYPPYIPNLEDQYLCAGTTTFALDAAVDGVYRSWQWQKMIDGEWQNTIHTGEGFYDLNFEESFTSPAEIEGSYRLVLQPYSECGDRTPSYISNELKVVVGSLLNDNPPLYTSHTQAEMTAGICANTQGVWFASGVPTGNVEKDVIGYQWYKKVAGTANTWLPVSSSENSTAVQDTFKLAYTRAEDVGTYRCQVIGVQACGEDNYKWSREVMLNVNRTAEITQSPVAAFACLGDTLVNGFSIALLEPEHLIGTSTFQWFKDGKLLTRLDNEFIHHIDTNIIRIDTIAENRYDTTWQYDTNKVSLLTTEKTLSFWNVNAEDGGEYQLQMTYINCAGQPETFMTTPVYLEVKEQTHIVSQSTNMYGIRGSYTSLEIVANTSGKPLDASVTYQWYRKYNDSRGTVKLDDNSKFHGAKTAFLTIINLTDDDMTFTDEDYYFCVINDWCLDDSLVSQPVKLNLAPDISITTHPRATTVCEGNDVTLTMAAASTDPSQTMYYQWFKDGSSSAIAAGENDFTLTLENVTAADASDYYCVVSFVSLAGTQKQTNRAAVTVEVQPVVISVTTEKPDKIGEPLRLEVVTANPNGNYNYEWYLNGFQLPPSTNNAVYYVAETTISDKGKYHCVVTSINGCGMDTSETIEIDIVGIIENDNPFFHIESVLPNPVTNEFVVKFMLPTPSLATLTLLDMSGRVITTLYSGNCAEGLNQVQISNKLSAVTSGAYFVLLESKGRKAAMKITISR